ncbi:MAG: Trk family potassium uptake protein [Phycisphaerae bacterium]|nr:Trk family potassium uptake protein [Phycisphaerae bacterium]
MDILYKNKTLERLLILTNIAATTAVAGTALLQLGFFKPILSDAQMYLILAAAAIFFTGEKFIRFFNARSKKDYLHFCWFEFIFIVLFAVLYFSAGILWALGVYLLMQIITKVCRTMVNIAAAGKSPAAAFIGSFIALILAGALLLMLPRSHTQPVKFIDALFTSTSATCVTGLTVKNTGADFSIIGHTVILCLIQLGGLGIVIFGAVFALLFGQALNVRQAAAMQDLLIAQTVSKIAKAIAFVFVATIVIEGWGAICLYKMWDLAAPLPAHITSKWFCSVFHSVSAFCNAGLGLFSDNLIRYNFDWRVYGVICPLIILGGLGFGVLENLYDIFATKIKNLLSANYNRPVRMELQTKIVLLVTAILIVGGTAGLLIFHNNTDSHHINLADAFFQAVTARTAGFNTIDINTLSAPAKMILIILMFIGGSPGGTAGGIKTVTLAVIIMAIYATIRKRAEVEIFKRSIPLAIVGKALVVVSLFMAVLFSATFLMTITERHNDFDFIAIMFEAASALGTVGLSCGITPALTTAGKIIIIITMLIGRLGPLTLLAVLTFNIKPARYNYPTESVVVG